MYKILLDKRVEKQIASLHNKDQEKVIIATDNLPQEFSKAQFSPKLKKLVGEADAYRYRVGSLRILFYRDKNKKLLKIYKIGYRGGVYS
jgi:mRNA-degrading endonuclease RelE of RelBE toxin-antitoxin system